MFIGMKTLNGKEEMVSDLSKYWEDPEADYSIKHYETRLLGDFAYGIGTVNGTEKNPDTGKFCIRFLAAFTTVFFDALLLCVRFFFPFLFNLFVFSLFLFLWGILSFFNYL